MQSTKRIISFDVGIKNLAYCIVDIYDSSASSLSWQIVSWNCINLLTFGESLPDTAHLPLCQQSIPGKRKTDTPHDCGKRAKWRTPNGLAVHYCDKHAKMHTEWQIPAKEYSASYLNKLKLEPLKHLYQSVVNGEAKKKSEMVEQLIAHYTRICFVSTEETSPKKKISAGEADLIMIGRKIKQCLDADPYVTTAGRLQIIIENQISTIASRMKTIQGMIAQYFIMRFERNAEIEFVSSLNKLKGFERSKPSGEKGEEEGKTKAGYKANKTDGIRICSEFFEHNSESMANWRETFDKSSKRDDLADCFLQAVGFLTKKKTICYADNLKIKIV